MAIAPVIALLTLLSATFALTVVMVRPAGANEPNPDDAPLRVLVIGDSVLLGAADRIASACEDCEVVVDAAESRSTMTSVQAADAHEGPFDLVIALLGHNDATNATAVRSGFAELFDHFALVPRIVVLTLHEVRPGYAELNDHLRAAATERPNVVVADWNEAVAARPDATVSDQLHLAPAGVDLLTELIADEIEDARRPDEEPQDWTWEPGAEEIVPHGGDEPDAGVGAALEEFWDQDPPVTLEAVPDEVGGPDARPVLFGVIGLVIVVLATGAVIEMRRRRDSG